MPVRTDEKEIDILLDRSVDTIYPSKEALKEALLSGNQLTFYAGADATGDFLHIGHAINYLMLRRFHRLGHKIIVLIGDFTAMIGDPTDKSSARVRLSKEEVLNNLKTFKEQVGKILDFDDVDNPIEFRFNSEWLESLSFGEIVDLASNFTVQQMIERDTFQKRISEEKPLYVHEFFYPLMQGYDSVALDVDCEIGGTDQTFNMLAGRTLLKRYKDKEKFVITHPLLENPKTGEILMSKSEGTGIALNDTPKDVYGKTMALPDEGMMLVFEHCTEVPLQDIEAMKKELENGVNPKEIKMKLAYELVAFLHNESKAKEAQEHFESTFKEGEIPEDISVVKVEKGALLIDVVVSNGLVESKSQFRRLIEQNAVKDARSNKPIETYEHALNEPLTVKVGKRRFIQIEIND